MTIPRIGSILVAACLIWTSVTAFGAQDTSFSTRATRAVGDSDWASVASIAREWKQAEADAVVPDWLSGYAALAVNDVTAASGSFARIAKPSASSAVSDWARALVQAEPASAGAQILAGDALARAGKYEDAIRALDEAVRIDGKSALAYDVRGTVKALAGTPDAVADFEKAIDLQPDFADSLANLGIVHLSEGDLLGAIDFLDKAIGSRPNFAFALNARGVVYCQMRAWKEAENDFRRAKELQPSLSFTAENLRLLGWQRAKASFRNARDEDDPTGRGSTFIVSALERYSVPIGDGRSIDVISIKNTRQTADLAGTEEVLRHVTEQLRTEGNLPADWKPAVLFAQPGLGSSAYAERTNFARMAFNSGKDFVVSVDMTDRFQWPDQSKDIRMARIDEDVSHRFERAVVAANHVWGTAPDVVLESQATRLLLNGTFGSVTPADLHDRGILNADFKLNKVVVIGMPLRDQSIGDSFGQTRINSAMAIATSSKLGLICSEPVKGASSVEVWELGGTSPSHGTLFSEQWRGRQPNPLPSLIGLYLRGVDTKSLQEVAAVKRDQVPIYTSPSDAPTTVQLSMASMTRRGLTDPTRDAVLIGCKDPKLGQMMKAQFGDSWRVQVVPETDPAKLQQMARQGGFSRINSITDASGSGASAINSHDITRSSAWTLPDSRAFSKGLDLYGKTIKLSWDVAKANGLGEMAGGLAAKMPLTFAAPLFDDVQTMRKGQFSPWVSKTLERFGELGVGEMGEKRGLIPTGTTDLVKGLAQQIGRGSYQPSLDERIHYYDAFGKSAIFVAVNAYSRSPTVGKIAADGAGLAVNVIDEYGIKPYIGQKYGAPQVEAYRFNALQLAKRGMEVPTMTRYFGESTLGDLHISQAAVKQNDAWATAMNVQTSQQRFSAARPAPQIELPMPTIVTRDDNRSWQKAAAGFSRLDAPSIVQPTNYRLPSSALPGDNRGGVAMKTEVVTGQPADTSELFGGGATTQPAQTSTPLGFVCPFMIFGAALDQ